MRFRITHLLIAAVVVAINAIAVAQPTILWTAIWIFTAWLLFAILACKAIAQPSNRTRIASALVVGLSFVLLCKWEMHLAQQSSAYAFLWKSYPPSPYDIDAANAFQNRIEILTYSIAILAGMGGASLAAWFSKTDKNA